MEDVEYLLDRIAFLEDRLTQLEAMVKKPEEKWYIQDIEIENQRNAARVAAAYNLNQQGSLVKTAYDLQRQATLIQANQEVHKNYFEIIQSLYVKGNT